MIDGRETFDASRAIQEDLVAMPVRENLAESFFYTRGSGFYIPTRHAWRDEIPERLGDNLRQFYDGDGVLRFYSLNDAGFRRHERAAGRWTGRSHVRYVNGDPIHAAEVTDITDVHMRRGRRLPVLGIMEIGPNPDARDLVISIADLAHYIQTQQAEIELTS